MSNSKRQRLSAMLQQVGAKPDDLAPPETLEAFAGEPLPAGDAMHDGGMVESMPDELDVATESLDRLLQGQPDDVDEEGLHVLEAIVMPYYRPVVDITGGHMVTPQLSNQWRHLGLGDPKRVIESTFNAIGRIEIPQHPLLPYAGSGFLVGKSPDGRGMLMTNRHVAEIFATGAGLRNLRFRPGQTAAVDFLREFGRADDSDSLIVEKVLMIHPFWDMALLQVVGLSEERQPLRLSTADPADLQEREVVTVGYPGYDPSGDMDYQTLQNRIFRGIYSVKRLQPGLLKTREEIKSFDHQVQALTHDCSTLGGNSGSAVLLLPQSEDEQIQVIGLHFAGLYLHANYAVPTHDLATDSRVVDTGIAFSGPLPPANDEYGSYWAGVSAEGLTGGAGAAVSRLSGRQARVPLSTTSGSPSGTVSGSVSGTVTGAGGQTSTWTIPLEVSVTLGAPELRSAPTGSDSFTRITGDVTAETEGFFSRRPEEPDLTFEEITAKFSRPALAADTFDWHAALSCAVASSLAYQHQAVVESTAVTTWGFEHGKFIQADDTECFIASKSDTALIAFRGTQQVRDWLANLNAVGTAQRYGTVHSGFFFAFGVVKALLEQELDRIAPSRVVLTGHSLGGALSTIAAAEWAGSYPVTGVYTFGQPAVGRGTFGAFFSENYDGKFFRFVNDDDIVPRVPPNYQHVGRLIHFDAQGSLQAQVEALGGGSGADMLTEAEFDLLRAQLLAEQAAQESGAAQESLGTPSTEGLLPSVSDHSLNAYIRKVEANLS